MKKIIKLSALAFILLLFSCSDDDQSNSSNQGFLEIGESRVELTQGYLENYGAVGDSYNMDFTARSKTLFNKSEDEAVIYFEMFSSTANDLTVGTYELGTYSEGTPFTYTNWGQILLGKGVSPFETGLIVSTGLSLRPTLGTFTVHESGKNYKISFTGVGKANYYKDKILISTTENVSFSLEYNGSVVRYNNEGSTSKSKNSLKGRPNKNHNIIID